MSEASRSWAAQKKGWALLKGLHPSALDLERLTLLQAATREQLSSPEWVGGLLLELGLNDEGLSELPASLHRWTGQGLRIWQYPIQFSAYLVQLSRLKVRSYLEIGVRHGGSFVATVEYLERFSPLDRSVAVDVIPCPSLTAYAQHNPKAEFACINTLSPAFPQLLERLGSIDLVFIDSHHEEEQCRRELALIEEHASLIAFHDIANVGCPGVRKVWSELASRASYQCFEFVEQYPGLGPYMGIGLAVRKTREA